MVSHYNVVYGNRLPTLSVIALTGRGDPEGNKRSDHFLASSMDDGVVDCKISDIYVGDAFNHMILGTGCPT